jgi:hypothetical protein
MEGEKIFQKKKKEFWGYVRVTSGKNFSSIGRIFPIETLVPMKNGFAEKKR